MRRLALHLALTGSRLAMDVYDVSGMLLLKAGSTLTEDLKFNLTRWGVKEVATWDAEETEALAAWRTRAVDEEGLRTPGEVQTAPDSRANQAESPGSEPARKRTVLIADDDKNTRSILHYFLERAGYRIVEARDGIELLFVLEREKVDAILLDSVIPNVDGHEACRIVKKHLATKDIPVIMCTGKSDKDSLVNALAAGAADYIVKPFTKDTVLRKVASALANVGD